MKNSDIRGVWAVVTGASSGLGVDFARELAARGANLVLAARRREPMEALADELRARHAVQSDVVPLDLAKPGSSRQLYEASRTAGRDVRILINNAGFGLYGRFLALSRERQLEMIDLNVRALVELTHHYAPAMVQAGFGRIMQVASMAGLLPIPRFNVYAAGKAFVVSFSEALNRELRRTGVTCTVLCPGPTRTGFFKAADHDVNVRQDLSMMESPDVARIGIHGMLAGRRRVIPGTFNRLLMGVSRLLPRRLLLQAAEASMRGAVEPAK